MTQVRRVRALDVARAAGVSKTTVSYVLNDTPHQSIPEETRQRVLDAAQRLNYTPLSAARALRKGHSDIVLLLIPDWPLGRVRAIVIEALTEELERHGLFLIARRQRGKGTRDGIWRELVPAAVIGFGEIDRHEKEAMRKAGVFVASALLASPGSTKDALAVPQELIGSLQVQHLAARGHRSIGFAAPAQDSALEIRRLRVEGARRVCLELGLDDPQVLEFEMTLDAAVAGLRHWTTQSPPVTAVAAFNDELAVALLAAVRELGMRAPADFAVIGVDNEPLAQFAHPPLTTIDHHHQVVAAHLARVVVSGITGGTPPDPPRSAAISLVIRESA